MKNHVRLSLLLALLTASVSLAKETAAKTDKVKATTPEVQTAKWAQRWWMPRHKQKLKEIQERKQIDLVMIGDSITHSWEGRGKKTWEKYYAPRNALNLGFSGDRTEQVLWRLQNGAVKGLSPKLAVVMIGTNNTGHRQDKPAETAAGVKLILKELRERLPKTKVLLLAIFPRGAEPGDKLRKLNEATNELIAKFADGKNVFFLNINDKFLAEDGALPKSIMPDRLHPNEKGYQIWAEAMEPMIKKLMGEA